VARRQSLADSLRVYTCRKMRASVLRAALARYACRRPAPHLADGLLLVAEGARELVGRLLLLHHLERCTAVALQREEHGHAAASAPSLGRGAASQLD